ncbi:sensor domain-containing diguanylate cyclase [Virgibacillus necropolis]|uniref:GGDEF domain-containing protein n=1 Tax=Virgibacillus necropolis TaxID=163877 RepID=A0A221MBP8_9BACI|nr:sensor domain-containing diguanylate cyclase [Virgibacillus necropolis]ASN05098.1 GGDEF domain-containing protein [Virgibacillus necropolis]
MVSVKRINVLLIIWAIFWPLSLFVTFNYTYLNIQGNLIDIVLFGTFMCVVASFPLVINNAPIFFVNGISIAVFVSFGLFAEMILTQLAILFVLIRVGVGKKEYYRYPLNLLMFTVVSIVGALVYYLLGGNHESFDFTSFQDIIAIFGYAISAFLVNQLIIHITQRVFYQKKDKLFSKGFFWELQSTLIVLPVGFVLFILYDEIGRIAIFYMGIPFVMISVILRLLYSYHEVNRYLEETGEIGHQLTKRMEVNQVHDIFINKLCDLVPMDCSYIYMVVDNHLELVRFYDVTKKVIAMPERIAKDEAFSGKVWATEKPIIYNNSKEWITIKHSKIPDNMESVISLPIEYNNRIIGIVTIITKEKKAYGKVHLRILTILTNYLGVAIENAKNYEITKTNSEIDGLTKLYNYRYFNNAIEEYGSTSIGNSVYSLILLDLDHFKQVNDTYGHEAGNEILCLFADRLTEFIGDQGLVARYGGEEFVVSLPHVDLKHAFQMAEAIRVLIADTPFPVEKHILPHDNVEDVPITASIGVAAYPEHCESPIELIRHADRAMYLGAKQCGRNKVAIYQELQSI